MEQKKRAWVYCRIDAPEDAHGALKGQRQQLMDYADQMNFIVAGSSEDLASGLSFDRPGLNRFVEAAEVGRIDVLLVHDMSRIGRNTCQTMAFLEQFAQKGVTVYSPLEGELTFSLQKTVQDVISHSAMERRRQEEGNGTEKRNQRDAL